MGRKRRANKQSPAIVTRSSSRRGKPKLGSDSDPQPPINVARSSSGSGHVKLDGHSDPQPPKSKKSKTNTSDDGGASSSMASKKKADMEPAAIVTQTSTHQRGKAKLPLDSNSQPPKSKKAKTNTSDGGGASSSAVATRSSKRRGKEIINSPLAVAKKSSKKMANVESSAKGKAKLDSDPVPPADPQPPMSKKPKGTTPISSSISRGKVKMVLTRLLLLTQNHQNLLRVPPG